MAEKNAKEEKGESGSVALWRPFGELEAWPSFFEEAFSSRLSRLIDERFRETPWAGRGWAVLPAMDVNDSDAEYTITVELPGTRKDDVHVEVHESMLTIRGEKKSEREEKNEKRRYVERSYGSFSRSFRLPPDGDAEHLDASFKDGVLTITIPKTEQVKPRTVAIK